MEKVNQKPNRFGSKKHGISILPVVFSSLLAAGAVAGAGVATWQVAKNHTESSEFTKSVSGRIKIDPAAMLDDEHKSHQTRKEAEDILSQCAEKLSRWLKDKGQKSYDVTYEIYGDDQSKEPGEQYFGYLNAQFEIDKVQRKHYSSDEEKNEKIDNDAYLSFFDASAFNSNEKTLVYRWYLENPGENDKPQYTIIPFRSLFSLTNTDKSKAIVDKDGKNGVLLQTANQNIFNEIFKNLSKAKKDSEEKETSNKNIENWCQPRLYIVNNLEGLYNEANYHLSYWWASHEEDRQYLNWYENTDYASFAEKYKTTSINNLTRKDEGETEENYFRLASVKNHEQDGKTIANADIFNYIDIGTPGTNEISFTKKYVDKIFTMSDFADSMPEKITDDYKNDVDIDGDNVHIQYFWVPATTKNEAQAYLNNQVKYGFNQATVAEFDFSNITQSGKIGGEEVYQKFTHDDFKKTEIAPSFSETVFGGNNVVGILSLGFLIFLIALLVILAVLYRTTGVMSWITMIFALSMTALIATISSTAISMSLLFGLFTMAIAGFIGALCICGRMRRRLKSNEDTQLMIKKTFKKSLLPLVDISIIALVFGVCFTYIAPITLNPLGLVLIIGAFAIFISEYLINGLLHILFFNNQIMINRYAFIGKPSNVANAALAQSNNAIPSTLDATRLEFPYYSGLSKKKLDTTNRSALIAVAVVGALLIVCIILFTVLGYTSSSMFHTSTCVAIKFDGDLLTQPWFKDLSYAHYNHDLETNWWYFYTNAGNASQVAAQIAKDSGLTLGNSVLIQHIFGSTNQDILNLSLISVLVATLCCSVYGIIRYNWIAFVPMLAGVFGMPLIILGLAAAFQIKFDQFVVIGFVFVVVINTIFTANIVGNINESWSRKDAYNKQEFKYIVNVALTNSWIFILLFACAYAAFILIFGLTAPAGASLISIIGLMIIAFVVTLLFVPATCAFLLYQFMKVRNVVLNKIVAKNKNKVVVNYDDIDEQGIEGINKFTRHIPIAKEQKEQEVK